MRARGPGLEIHDVTLTLAPGMPVHPGEPGVEVVPIRRLARGDDANVSSLGLGLHTGTHVDAPLHFIEGGADASALPLASLCGPARVVAIADRRAVTVAELEDLGLAGTERVLFKTRNSGLWAGKAFREDFVFVTPEAARWLVKSGLLLVGIDYLSIEAFGAHRPLAHEILLRSGVVIVEGLDLRLPPPGEYELWCLPLKVAGGDAAPARVVLASRGGRTS